jgi:drug/metabolite transporter (DMT)-like permease
MPPILGGAISIPSATLLFWLISPFVLHSGAWDTHAALIFCAVGLLFPATVTLLSFEANRRMGPNTAGAVGNLAPLFAVLFAIVMLGEALRPLQAVGIAAIVGGVMMLSRPGGDSGRAWRITALALPLVAAIIRGAIQPAIKAGLMYWPDPMVAVLMSYTVSSALVIGMLITRKQRGFTARGVSWFAAVGFSNGFAVLAMYAALGRGTVTLVSPLVATYPLVTLALSHVLLRHERVSGNLIAGVGATVLGIVLLLAA